jgi:hypothetical protein
VEVQRIPRLFARLRTTVCAAVIDSTITSPSEPVLISWPLPGDSGFDGQQFAAHLRPRQAGHLTDLVLLLGQAVAEFTHAQEVLQQSAVTFTEKRFSSACL